MVANNISLTKPQFYALLVMNAIALIGIFLSFYSGQEDRQIIKVRVAQILGGLDQTLERIDEQAEIREARSNRSDFLQNVTLAEIITLERVSDERAMKLVGPLERSINQTNVLSNASERIEQKVDTLINLLNRTN